MMGSRAWWVPVIAAGVIVGCLAGWIVGSVETAVRIGFALVVGILMAIRLAVKAWPHQRLSAGLSSLCEPATVQGVDVKTGPLAGAAFVAGLRRPQIYCDRRLLEELTAEELKAVLLHERSHQERRDPLKRIAVDSAEPLLRHWPAGQGALMNAATRLEIQADRYALWHGASRAALASALLKVSPALGQGIGFAPAVNMRLRALLGEDMTTESHRARKIAFVLVPVALACATLAFPHTSLSQLAA